MGAQTPKGTPPVYWTIPPMTSDKARRIAFQANKSGHPTRADEKLRKF